MKMKVIEEAGPNVRVELGDIVRDSVNGFEGSVESITVWRFGCRRIQVRPTKLKDDGSPLDAVVFDEPGLHILKRENTPKPVQEQRQRSGGPKDARSESRALSRN